MPTKKVVSKDKAPVSASLAAGRSSAQRRKLLKHKQALLNLSAAVVEEQQNYRATGDVSLLAAIEKTDHTFRKAINSDGGVALAAIDAETVSTLSKSAVARVENLRLGRTYTVPGFCDKLKSIIAGENWPPLFQYSSPFFQKSVTTPCFLLGPLTAVPVEKQRKERAPIVRQKKAALKQAEELKADNAKAEDQAENTKRINEVKQILKKVERINFFDLVIDPDSYSQTIENIFHFSFLIKEGHASMQVDDDGDVVADFALPASTEGNSIQSDRKQCVFTIDYSTWQHLVKLRQLSGKKALIPHRDYSDLVREAQAANQREDDDDDEEEEEEEEEEGEDDDED